MNALRKCDILEFDMDDLLQDGDMELQLKTICDLTLYDLMGVDHDVWIKRNKKFGFDIEIDNDEDRTIYKDSGVHAYAMESLATFCRRFLNTYSSIVDKELP